MFPRMKLLTASALAVFWALPVQASDWDIPRPQFDIPDQLAQAPAPAKKRSANVGIYDEALEHRRAIQRHRASTHAPQKTHLAQNQTSGFGGRIYIGGALSGVFMDDAELGSTNSSANAALRSISSELTFDTGWGGSAAVGWRFLPAEEIGPRLELEGAYQHNDVDQFNSSRGNIAVDGDASVFSLMANFVLDVYTGTPVVPYFGAGVGASWVDAEITASGQTTDADDRALTGQLIGGVAYALTDTLFLTLDYRYFLIDELDLEGGTLEPRIHKVSLGMRHQF